MTRNTQVGLLKGYAGLLRRVSVGRCIAASTVVLGTSGWAQDLAAPAQASGGIDGLFTALPIVLVAAVALISAIRTHTAARTAQRELEQCRKTQATLAVKESIFRAIVENSGAGLWQLDGASRTVYLNPAMATLLQIDTIDDLAGLNTDRLLVKHDGDAKAGYTATVTGRHGQEQKVLVSETPISGMGDATGVLRSVLVLAQRDESAARDAVEAGADARKPRQATISPIMLRPAAQA